MMLSAPKSARLLAALAVSLFFLPSIAFGQYIRADLVTDATDPNLVNGWGLTRAAQSPALPNGSPFWVSDNVTGKSTLYNGAGQAVPLVVTIPPAPTSPPPPGKLVPVGSPTGTVFNITLGNPMPSFSVSNGTTSGTAIFLFDTLDGTISGWAPGVDFTHALIAVDRSSSVPCILAWRSAATLPVISSTLRTTARTAASMCSTKIST